MAVGSLCSCPSPPLTFPSSSPPRFRISCSSSQLPLSPQHKTITQIKNSGIIACLRAQSAELAMEAARAALSGGISVLEIVMSTPSVFEVIQQLVLDYPTTIIGVGTVLNSEDAKNAMNAGAKFLMSPAMVKNILDDIQAADVLYIPGAMTPTEILCAYDAGAKIVKVYPVSALGGIHYISALNKPFGHIPMVASQGITIDSIAKYIACGASSVVLSDAIFNKEAMGKRNFSAIYQLAHLAALQGNEAVERLKRLVFDFAKHLVIWTSQTLFWKANFVSSLMLGIKQGLDAGRISQKVAKVMDTAGARPRDKWRPSSSGFFKINVDGALFMEHQCIGLGAIVRHYEAK
ncbi:hypothetical protein L1049_011610 [Liquidambar formosana]|uniref:Uncharacterized protein n=1 Tax=Liquidambar formosana TaxID=63359 RepID=A0AAP0RRP2_LIQFO